LAGHPALHVIGGSGEVFADLADEGGIVAPGPTEASSKRASGDDHQHIASDSAQAEVRHHQDQEPDRPKASGSLGVQVSAVNYFHARRQPAIGRTLSVLQDMTPVVADYSQLHFSRIVA
jgi:hypothetical protein